MEILSHRKIAYRLKQRMSKRWLDLLWLWRSRNPFFDIYIKDDIRLRLFTDSKLCEFIFKSSFELSERIFVQKYLRPGDVFIDVGANIGLFSMIAAREVGPKGQVHAFEPSKETWRRLCQNVRINNFGNVVCVHSGLSETAGILELLKSTEGYDAWNSFGKPIKGLNFRTEKVEVHTLDKYVADHDLTERVGLIKIDVEGWETRVLAGASNLLSHNCAPDLLVEFSDKTLKLAGSSYQELYQNISQYGYKLYRYDNKNNCIIPESLTRKYDYINLIATKSINKMQARIA